VEVGVCSLMLPCMRVSPFVLTQPDSIPSLDPLPVHMPCHAMACICLCLCRYARSLVDEVVRVHGHQILKMGLFNGPSVRGRQEGRGAVVVWSSGRLDGMEWRNGGRQEAGGTADLSWYVSTHSPHRLTTPSSSTVMVRRPPPRQPPPNAVGKAGPD
jgi:hypothetical protein